MIIMMMMKIHTSPEQRSPRPIRSQQHPRAQADALRKVHAPPEIHGQQATAPVQPVEIEDGRVPHVRQAAEVLVLERLVHGLVDVAVVDPVGPHHGQGRGDLVELVREILALLVGALRRGGEGGELRVDLAQELVEFAEVERAGLVLVVLLEEQVQAAKVVRGLGEALLYAARDVAPFSECEVDLLGVFAFLPGDGAQEGDEVVRDVVLNGGAVTDGVHVAQGCSDQAQMAVRL